MRFGSLFSGIGGFDAGFEQAGFTCEWQVELDADCRRVLEKHWSGVARHKDVRDIGELESVDVVCGGFPCQDLSVAGKRAGLAGERSGLWFEFLRIVGLNRPRFVVIENVPGLLSSDEGRDFAVILRGLVECGYCLAWRIVDAQFYGVAQRRRRVFIVGSLGNGRCAEILFESESVSWNPPTRGEAGQGIASAVTTGTGKSSGPRNGNGDPLNLISHPLKGGGNSRHDESHETYVTHALRSEGADASEDGTGRGTPLVCATLNSGGNNGGFRSEPGDHLIAFSSKDHGADAGAISPTLRSQNFKDSHVNGGGQVAIAFHENKSGQLSEADVLGVRAGASHSYQGIGGDFGVRRLTPRECERLQSFPDDWTRWDANGKEISDSARYRMLGNAVCVNVARWIGKRILAVAK